MARIFGKLMTVLLAWLLVGAMSSGGYAFQTSGKALIIVDYESGLVLAEKNADAPLPPASMSKIMTVYMLFKALQDGRLSLTDKLPVSKEAAAYGGSTMFLKAGERVSVEDLIRGVVVLSGNDASAVIAEALSPDGTEAGFARLMTEHGRSIGLTNSVFRNSNGWPDPDHRMSVRDLAILTKLIISEFPNYYTYFAEQEFNFDDRAPANSRNRNPLLKLDFGADGLKTGYTKSAGYGIVGSAVRGARRMIFVVTGLDSRTVRANEAERIVNWYFVQFRHKILFEPGETVVKSPVWMGTKPSLNVTVEKPVGVLVAATFASEDIIGNAIFDENIEAPVVKGQKIGRLELQITDFPDPIIFSLIAGENVERGGIIERIKTVLKDLINKSGIIERFIR